MTDRPRLVVSACLLGEACNYRGGASPRPMVEALADRFELVAVCPEVAGRLGVPRPRAERGADGRVRTVDGADVSVQYQQGAAATVQLARSVGAVGAVLKARSPSCGCDGIYDGTFTETLVPGRGVTAEALEAAGFEVMSEEHLAAGLSPGMSTGGSEGPDD